MFTNGTKEILQMILLMAPHSANTEAECSKQSPQFSQRAALPALCRIQSDTIERSGKFCPNSGEHNPDHKPFTHSTCCTLGSTENDRLPDKH